MRAKKLKSATKSVARPTGLVLDIFGADILDNEEEDSSYEDSDVELIPRPIQRARRTNSRVRLP